MILAYHEIEAEESGYRYGLTRLKLREQLKYVAGFQRAAGRGMPAPLITFDDGHLSAYQHALPLLEEHGLKGVFFILAGWTQNRRDYMTWSQVREIVALGHRVQSHGWSHRFLTHCSPSELENELLRSKQALEEHLGISVDSLSAPGGRWDARVLRVCAKAGYRFLYISNPWLRSRKQDGIELRGRLTIQRDLSVEGFARWLAEDGRGFGFSRAQYCAKELLRRLVGDRLYHRLWCRLAGWERPEETMNGFGVSDSPRSVCAGVPCENSSTDQQ
ncbi:MAG TPA: polysaccharide deacetylase family protein [Terriglobia bacterium]|nr:polysaccharide deacetylase family protein [Terriglobia bacterium]